MSAQAPGGRRPRPRPPARPRSGGPSSLVRAAAQLLCGALAIGALGVEAEAAGSVARPGLIATAGRAGQALERMDLRELLGRERWRQLEEARFRIHLHELTFTPSLADDPSAHDEVGRILLRSLLKGSQEALERRLRLEERRDALRDRLRGHAQAQPPGHASPRLAAAPRFHLDRELWAGAKLYLRGARSPFWSFADLRLGSELDGGNPSVKLAFHDDERHGFVSYHFDHPERGEAIELRFALSF